MESAVSATPVFEDPPPSHAQADIIRDGYSMITQTLQEPLHELHCEAEITQKYFAIFDVFPFAAGAQRLAFKGSIYERIPDKSPAFRVHVVVKLEMATRELISKTLLERTLTNEDEANKTILKHDRTTGYANKWCQLGINKSVYVLSAEKVKLVRGCSLSDIDKQKYPMMHHLFKLLSLDSVLYPSAVGTVEDFLPGRFMKFLNNDGNENNNVIANFPAAFAHWTWVDSGGELMISDIQGVRTSSGYVLTDPCVHSTQDSTGFGISDLGMLGVEEFFKRHKCNELCKDLGLGLDGEDLDLGHSMRTRLRTDPKTKPARVKSSEDDDECWSRPRVATVLERSKAELFTGDRIKHANIEARRNTEAADGKIQRRATLRVFERRRSLRNEMEEEVKSRSRRRSNTGRPNVTKSGKLKSPKKADHKNNLLSAFPILFRLNRKGS